VAQRGFGSEDPTPDTTPAVRPAIFCEDFCSSGVAANRVSRAIRFAKETIAWSVLEILAQAFSGLILETSNYHSFKTTLGHANRASIIFLSV
jgi:hypothetical protein